MKTLFKIPYECRRMSPAFEMLLICLFILALAMWFAL